MENEQPHNDEGRHEEAIEPTSPESRPEIPRIYVASLSDYNDGRLHGAWIDADSDPDVVFTAVQAVLDSSPSEGAEEFAIFDFEGFTPWRPGEYESIPMVSAVAQGIEEHGRAFAHWVEVIEAREPDDLVGFEDAYLGYWDSLTDYAEELVAGCCLINEDLVPEVFAGYVFIDYEGIARDMELSGDVTTSEGDGGVYVFDGHR